MGLRIGLALSLALILGSTLVPRPGSDPLRFETCLLCGEHGLADAFANLLLFVPLGLALGLRPCSTWTIGALAGFLSLALEMVQLFVPGRTASPSDLLFNVLGALLGGQLGLRLEGWAVLAAKPASRICLAVGAACAGAVALTGALLEPSFPESRYYGGWTPELGHLGLYRGEVLEAHVGDLPIPPGGLVEDSSAMRNRLEAGSTIHVRALAGPEVRELSPLVSLFDEQQREIVLIGPDRSDLLFRFRTRAAGLRLEHPGLLAPGVLAGIAPGDELEISIGPAPRGHRIEISGSPDRQLGFSVGNGWAFLVGSSWRPIWLHRVLDGAWLAGLLLPLGFWARWRWESLLGATLALAGLALVPRFVGLVPVPLWEWVGALLGVASGVGLGRLSRRTTTRGSTG